MNRLKIIDGYGKLRLRLPGVVDDPDDPSFALRFLTDGDSWFSAGYGPVNNMLMHFIFSRPALALNLAAPGRKVSDVVGEGLGGRFGIFTSSQYGSAWDAILLSLTGHDLIVRQGDFVLVENGQAHPEDYVDGTKLKAFLDAVAKDLTTLLQWIDRQDSSCRGKPVFVHTYDYIVPRPSPVRLFPNGPAITGPDVKPVYDRLGIRAEMRPGIVRFLLQQLGGALVTLSQSPAGQYGGAQRLFVVPTQGMLLPADPTNDGVSADWENEDHPTPDGYEKLGSKYAAQVATRLGL